MQEAARKRIVGAGVLILLGVLLPLLLVRCMSRGGPAADETPMREYEITSSGDIRISSTSDREHRDTQAASTTSAATSTARQPTTDAAQEQETQSKPGFKIETPTAQSAGADHAGDSKPQTDESAQQAEESSTERAAESAADASATDGETTAANDAASLQRSAAAGDWVVQVASFDDRNNARALAQELQSSFEAFYTTAEID